jgi:hypothetical protein
LVIFSKVKLVILGDIIFELYSSIFTPPGSYTPFIIGNGHATPADTKPSEANAKGADGHSGKKASPAAAVASAAKGVGVTKSRCVLRGG